jgi:uncharacterized membrane protein
VQVALERKRSESARGDRLALWGLARVGCVDRLSESSFLQIATLATIVFGLLTTVQQVRTIVFRRRVTAQLMVSDLDEIGTALAWLPAGMGTLPRQPLDTMFRHRRLLAWSAPNAVVMAHGERDGLETVPSETRSP